MATIPLIFPSLSRQPAMDSSKSTEDDTIKDQAESGYTSTRPRFTRARRTWKVNVRNLLLEDIRALDAFHMGAAARGGNAFLYPNLLPNGSFELPALSAADLVFGWNVANAGGSVLNVAIAGAPVFDGAQALKFTAAGSLAADSTQQAEVDCDWLVPCVPGDVHVFAAQTNLTGTIVSNAAVTFFDANGVILSTASGASATGSGWQSYSFQFTIPAGAVSYRIAIKASVQNATGSPESWPTSSITWDAVGCALLAPVTPYGRMVGSAPLGCFVRFASLPETSDIGFGQGVKRYGAHFELTEV